MKLSMLNLVPVREGQDHRQAIQSMVRLAQHAEHLGLARLWIAEHHNMKNLASSATQLLIMHALEHTKTLKVGSGGVMLPNHSPYVVAEQYGTLATLFPDRVELGLGRAPGTDMQTAFALRKNRQHGDFASEIAELRGYFDDCLAVSAYPAAGVDVPFYILGSSTESAYLAAELGLPYAFAAHFAPRMLDMAVKIYRERFKPSVHLAAPYVIVGANAIVADTDEEAKFLATTQTQFFLNVVTHAQQKLQPPLASEERLWQTIGEPLAHETRAAVEQMTAFSFIGSPKSVAWQLDKATEHLAFDEIMAVSYIYDEEKQAQSYRLLKAIVDSQ